MSVESEPDHQNQPCKSQPGLKLLNLLYLLYVRSDRLYR
jgi:hypothetical protein